MSQKNCMKGLNPLRNWAYRLWGRSGEPAHPQGFTTSIQFFWTPPEVSRCKLSIPRCSTRGHYVPPRFSRTLRSLEGEARGGRDRPRRPGRRDDLARLVPRRSGPHLRGRGEAPGSRLRPPPIPSQLRLTVGASSLTWRSGGRSRRERSWSSSIRRSKGSPSVRAGLGGMASPRSSRPCAFRSPPSRRRRRNTARPGRWRSGSSGPRSRSPRRERSTPSSSSALWLSCGAQHRLLGGLPARSCGGRGTSRRGEDEPARGGAAGSGA